MNLPNNNVISAQTRFGLKLFTEIAAQDAGKNIFISPASIAIALTMTYNGAKDATRAAMAETLELQGLELVEINRATAALMETLENADPEVALHIANSLWLNPGFAFIPQFLQTNREFYRAKLDTLSSADVINKWVREQTAGKIDQMVERIDPLIVLILLNAIYFKGTWRVKFDEKLTKLRRFTRLDGKKRKVPMMFQSGNYAYFEDRDFQAISLPYGAGRVSMYIFLPAENSSLATFQKELTVENWEKWMFRLSRSRDREGEIVLPRFKVEYARSLNDVLGALGMEVAFGGRANFGNMCPVGPGDVYIAEVLHKAFVEVNEEGTEAAAATKVEVRRGMMTSEPRRFRMIVDRPFFCAIRDNETGALLFMGNVVNP